MCFVRDEPERLPGLVYRSFKRSFYHFHAVFKRKRAGPYGNMRYRCQPDFAPLDDRKNQVPYPNRCGSPSL